MNKKSSMTDDRAYFKPFNYPWCYDAFLESEKMHWLPQEVPMIEDVNDWKNKLTESEKKFLTHIFRFFTQGDIDVAGAYVSNYLPVFPQPEIRMMLASFAARECFDDKTEVLTNDGWKLFSKLTEQDKVAQFDVDTKEISFDKPMHYIQKPYVGKLHHYKNTRTDICVTPNHRLLLINPHTRLIQLKESSAGKWGRNFLYPVNGEVKGSSKLTTLEKLLIAIQADGTLKYGNTSDLSRTDDKSICFSLKKERKVNRLISYLNELGLNVNPLHKEDGMVKFNFSLSKLVSSEIFKSIKDLGFFDLSALNTQKANEIIEEVLFWDGSVINMLSYFNTNENAINNIQAIATLSDYGCTKGVNYGPRKVKILNNKHETDAKTCYVLTFTKESVRAYPHRKEIDYNGIVYCVTMPNGTVVTRRNGRVSIQGNCIHIAAYSHLIETLGMPETTYSEFLEYQEMKDKHDYIDAFIAKDSGEESKQTIAQQIAIFSAFTEGMQLFSSFIMLLNFTRFGKMKGMGQIISWSIADESHHAENMIKLFREFIKENKHIWNDELKSEIYKIATKMVELEDNFIDLSFGVNEMEGLTKDEVKKYIRYIADRRLISLGMKGIFKVKKNPLPWVDGMLGTTHSNFFEARVTDYAKGALTGSWGEVWA